MKGTTRKHLKEDEFVTTFTKVFNFAKTHTKKLIAVGVVLVFAVLCFLGFRLIKAQNLKSQSRLIGQIIQLRAELEDNPEKVAELEKLAGKGKFSRLAYIHLASYWIEEGEIDKAIDSLSKVSQGKKDFFYYQAQNLLAQIHISQENYDKAIEIYEKIEEEDPESYSHDVILFHHAQAHEEKGEIEEALILYKRVQTEFPQTYYGMDAAENVRKLEEKK